MNRKCIFIFLVFAGITGKAQDYYAYYTAIDSAKYFESIKAYGKADSLYMRTFAKYNGFHEDYEHAFYASLESTGKIHREYLEGFVRNHGFRFDLWGDRKTFKKKYNYHGLHVNRLYRQTVKYKINHKNSRLIRRLMRNDQKARKHHSKKIWNADSVTVVKLMERYKEDTNLFCMRQYKFWNQAKLEILLFHAGYRYWKNDIDILRKQVANGNASRFFFWYLFEREVTWGGNLFKLENGLLVYLPGQNQKCCGKIPYSLSGEFSFYNSTTKKQYTVPLYPNYTRAEIDAWRKYMYCSPYALYYETNKAHLNMLDEQTCEELSKNNSPGKK